MILSFDAYPKHIEDYEQPSILVSQKVNQLLIKETFFNGKLVALCPVHVIWTDC